MKWLIITAAIALASAGSVQKETDREGKLFSVFNIIKFNNDQCTGTSGNTGTCYTPTECSAKNGTADGTCAAGFGACCTATFDACATGNTIQINNTYIVNPGFPSGVSSATGCTTTTAATGRSLYSSRQSTITTYSYTLSKATTAVTQIRLDFLQYETDAPSMGDCSNGTLTITGVDATTVKTLPTNLCGVLTGQHLYLSVADSTTVTISIALTSVSNQKWRILVSQYESTQTAYLAPAGCLQYYRASAGTFNSFNNFNGTGEILNNHRYAICVAQVSGYCDVNFVSSSFDMGTGTGTSANNIVLGAETYTGATFGTSGSALSPYLGPYVFPVSTTDANTAMNAGFSLNWMLMPC